MQNPCLLLVLNVADGHLTALCCALVLSVHDIKLRALHVELQQCVSMYYINTHKRSVTLYLSFSDFEVRKLFAVSCVRMAIGLLT